MGMIACVVVAAIGTLLAVQMGAQANDGLLTLFATLPGVLVPMFILRAMPDKQPGQWGVVVIIGSVIRALITLTIGLAIYMVLSPSKMVFFLTILAALMITLIIDVVSVLTLIQKHPIDTMSIADAEGIS